MPVLKKFKFAIRENNEDLVKLKSVSSDNKIPRGILDNGKDAIKDGNKSLHTPLQFLKVLICIFQPLRFSQQ